MRAFWAFIVLFLITAAGAVAWNSVRTDSKKHAATQSTAPATETETGSAASTSRTPSSSAGKSSAFATPTSAPSVAKADTPTPPIASTTITPPPGKAVHSPQAAIPKPDETEPVTQREEPKHTPGAITPDGVPTKIGEYGVRPVKIKTNDDGSTTLDDRFTIKGDGSKGDPYRVPWELLLSCKDTFEPAAGLKKIPGRIAFLSGKFIRLDGYVAFPLMMQKPTELLAMLNQWDGCCIGVPPTPYDAVEVKLTKIVDGDSRFATSGVVIGKFKVDPYVVKNPKGDWLVSMFTMNAADFTAGDIGPGGNQ